jgi:hypothetical protein
MIFALKQAIVGDFNRDPQLPGSTLSHPLTRLRMLSLSKRIAGTYWCHLARTGRRAAERDQRLGILPKTYR